MQFRDSALNSVKRLNNDAAVKAEYWLEQFGASQVVPAAMLSGVFKVKNLEQVHIPPQTNHLKCSKTATYSNYKTATHYD